MTEIFLLTLENVLKTLVFTLLGCGIRKLKGFPPTSGTTMSVLVAYVFSAAYNINALSRDMTVANIAQKLLILGAGILFALAATVIGYLLGKPLGKNTQDKRTLIYAFAYTNYGYFGLPLVESVFGPGVLADVIVFTLPLTFAINIFGYWLLTGVKNFSWKTFLLSPVVWSPLLGAAIGLSGWQLPTFASDIFSSLAGCMSPVAMLLLGFVVGGIPFKKLLTDLRAYLFSLIRLLVIPGACGAILYLCGVRGIWFLLPMLIFAMPIGSNIIVFPESRGIDTTRNASLVLISYILSILLLPLTFSLISRLSGL